MSLALDRTAQGNRGFTTSPQAQSKGITDLLNQIIGAQQGGYNPSADFQSQLAMLKAGGGMQSRQAQQQYGFGQERLGLQGEQLGMQREQLGRQQNLAPKYQALDELGFGLTGQDISAGELAAWRGAEQSQRGVMSSATARGAVQTEGTRQDFTTIQQGLEAQLGGLGRERSRLDISKQRSKLGYQEQQAQLKDQSRNLDLMGKQLGISGREAKAQLDNALQQIGLSQSISAGDIARSIQKQLAGQYDPLSSITGQLISMAFGG